jgi:hypothetical protein
MLDAAARPKRRRCLFDWPCNRVPLAHRYQTITESSRPPSTILHLAQFPYCCAVYARVSLLSYHQRTRIVPRSWRRKRRHCSFYHHLRLVHDAAFLKTPHAIPPSVPCVGKYMLAILPLFLVPSPASSVLLNLGLGAPRFSLDAPTACSPQSRPPTSPPASTHTNPAFAHESLAPPTWHWRLP